MVEKLAKYEEEATEKSSESSSLEANDGSESSLDNSVMDKEEVEDLETKFQSQPDLLS